MTEQETIQSKYSMTHDWSIFWNRLPSNYKWKPLPVVSEPTEKEINALSALACVGLMTAKQFEEIYSIPTGKLKDMRLSQKIIRHEIKVNKKPTAIYTLGLNGAKIANMPAEIYEMNYWIEYTKEDIAKRILFFELVKQMKSVNPNIKVQPAPSPFTATISFKNKDLYVYGLRGDGMDFIMSMKWSKEKFLNKQIIILTEKLEHLELIKEFFADLQIRIATDETILSSISTIQDLFYFINQSGYIIKEVAK